MLVVELLFSCAFVCFVSHMSDFEALLASRRSF